jgi:putative ABC transport system permease protein
MRTRIDYGDYGNSGNCGNNPGVMQDLRFAIRLLQRDPRFALTVVLVLGLGIGVNNMLFTILNAHTIRGLPMYRADRVAFISTFDDRVPDSGVSYALFNDLEQHAQSFTIMAAFSNAPMVISGDGNSAERLAGAYVSPTAFRLIGSQPVLGRDFTPEDDRPGAAAVALVGTATWRTRYGGDRTLPGRAVMINGSPATIVGIVPERSGFPSSAEIWMPLHQMPGIAAAPDARGLGVCARLRDATTLAQARAEVEGFAARLARDQPASYRNIRARVVPVNERFLGRLTDPAWLAFMTVGFIVVLISCANVANLMLARTVRRSREIAIRSSLGASRRRVVRQLLIEGAVLAALGCAAGFGIALAGVRVFRSAIPADVLPYWFDYSVDVRVLAALIAVSATTVLLFALLPAVHASKTDVNRVLTSGGWSRMRGAPARWSAVFLAAEFGLAVVLLSHFAVNVRTMGPDSPADAALNTTHVLTAAITLPVESYRTDAERRAFYETLIDRVKGLPDVKTATVATALPVSGGERRSLEIAGRPPRAQGEDWTVSTVAIGADYFEAIGLPLHRGREFAPSDAAGDYAVAIVNDAFAERFSDGIDPIGQRIAVMPPQASATARRWLTIIGVAPSIRQEDPVVYVPHASAPAANAALIVRSGGNATALAPVLRKALQAIDPNLPLYRARTMAQVVSDAQWNGRVANRLFIFLTFLAVALCTFGLYAVTAHSITERTHEIGIRMALGARASHVGLSVAKGVVIQLAMGFAAGVVCTMLWDWKFPAGPQGIRSTDPQSLLIVAAVLAIVAGVASIAPLRRAVRLDPLVAIRHE